MQRLDVYLDPNDAPGAKLIGLSPFGVPLAVVVGEACV
jgi:hypothetical protein